MISTAKGPSKPLTGPLANAYGSRWASGGAASGNSIHLHPFGPDATTTQPVINHWQCQLGAEAFLWLDHSSTLQARGVEPPVPSNAVPGQRHNLPNAWIGKLCSSPRAHALLWLPEPTYEHRHRKYSRVRAQAPRAVIYSCCAGCSPRFVGHLQEFDILSLSGPLSTVKLVTPSLQTPLGKDLRYIHVHCAHSCSCSRPRSWAARHI